MKDRALVLFSGGQDSTTLLGWARNRYNSVHAIGFNYGQRHEVELEQAKIITDAFKIPYILVKIPFMKDIVISNLLQDGDINSSHPDNKELPSSFVPNRNALFLTIAHAYAQKIKANDIIGGMCQTDYSGYPDCRLDFIKKIQKSLNIGSNQKIKILTPLMKLTKAQTFDLAQREGFLSIVIHDSHTCYNGDHKTFHEWGFGCGECPACVLRAKGWTEYIYYKSNGLPMFR